MPNVTKPIPSFNTVNNVIDNAIKNATPIPTKTLGAGMGSVPDKPTTALNPNPSPVEKPIAQERPVITIPRPQLAQRDDERQPAQVMAKESTNYQDYMPNRVDNWVDPMSVETGISANAMAGGAFGGLGGMQAALAGMLPAVAHNKHNKAMNEQFDRDLSFAANRANEARDRQSAEGASNYKKLDDDRNYNLRLDDLALKKEQSALDKTKSEQQNAIEQQKISIAESDSRFKNLNETSKLKLERDKADQLKQIAMQRLKSPLIKMQTIYDENGFPRGTKPIAVDPLTGKIISSGDVESPDEVN